MQLTVKPLPMPSTFRLIVVPVTVPFAMPWFWSRMCLFRKMLAIQPYYIPHV